ncbi:hypothetical protein B0H13DRAFT_2668798 [Mycena leptocephala]|nr:hypothetical protein B0H13DRAFT_2668798 [Mycena leptocephala]
MGCREEPPPARLPSAAYSGARARPSITIPLSLERLGASFLAVCDWGMGRGVGGRGDDREVRYLAVFFVLVSVSSLPRSKPAWHRTRECEMGKGENEERGAPARDPRSFYCIPRWSDGLRSGGLKGMDELRAAQ